MVVEDNFKCTACGSKDLCFGYQGTAGSVFIPTGVFTIHGYKTRSYVCLKCGNVGHFLSTDKVKKLKERIKAVYEE